VCMRVCPRFFVRWSKTVSLVLSSKPKGALQDTISAHEVETRHRAQALESGKLSCIQLDGQCVLHGKCATAAQYGSWDVTKNSLTRT